MVEIKFSLAELTMPESMALVAMLRAYADNQPLVLGRVSASTEEDVPPVDLTGFDTAAPVVEMPVEEIKTKKTRTKKDVPTVQVEETASSEEPATSTVQVEENGELEEPTIEALREALRTYTIKHGMSAGIALLKQFGCTKVSEIQDMPLAEQANFLADSNA